VSFPPFARAVFIAFSSVATKFQLKCSGWNIMEDTGMEGRLSHLVEIKFVHCRPWASMATLADACTPMETAMAARDDATPATMADALCQYG